MTYDVIILGGGPAGLTAAIYTSRASIKTLVIAFSGGQLSETTQVENFPGFPNGIFGATLIDDMRKQSEKFGTEVVSDSVTKVSGNKEKGFTVETASEKTYQAKSILVATGASAKWLGLPNETRLRGKGVSACATCDGFFFKKKIVVMVGGGDASMEEACFLTKFAPKVYVLVRGEKETMKASKFMKDRAFSNPKVEFLFNTEVTDVLGEETIKGIKLFNNKTKENSELAVEGLFIAIGHNPNTNFLKGFVDLDEKGYIKITDITKTSVPGVFAAGDVADPRYRQAISAAGLGCMASLDVEKYLAGH